MVWIGGAIHAHSAPKTAPGMWRLGGITARVAAGGRVGLRPL
jgi:hypothetical protein